MTIMHNGTITETAVAAPDHRRRLALLAVLAAQFMLVLDATVVNVALPAIQADLHLAGARLTWINNSYLIAFGGLLLLFGRLGDLFGRRRIFLTGLVLFTAASAVCGLAASASLMIIARFAQGVGAAAASSVVLAIIATEFPVADERARAMSGYVFVSVSGGSVGLLLGGLLTQTLGWHWIFLINVPVGVATFVLARSVLRADAQLKRVGQVDVLGSILVTGTAMTIIYALIEAGTHAWSAAAVVVPGIAALVQLGAFLALETRLANPIFPPRVLRIRSLMVSSMVRGFMVMGMYATFFFGVLDLANGLGFGPMRIGLSFLPMTVTVAVLSRGLAARLMARHGPRAVLMFGLGAIALAMWSFATLPPAAPYFPARFLTFVLLGLGAGTSFLPLLTIAMSDVPAPDAGLGSAIVNLSMQLAAAIDLAILATFASNRTHALIAGGAPPAAALLGGYRYAFGVAMVGVLIAFTLAALVLRGFRGRRTNLATLTNAATGSILNRVAQKQVRFVTPNAQQVERSAAQIDSLDQ
jgi:EmrB/QacA subfamily drug resistance transporter